MHGCVGGIVGIASCIGGEKLIENCNNYGEVNSSYYYCGGIVGWQQRGTVKNCINEGSVTNVMKLTGGISGGTGRSDSDCKSKGKIEQCLNKGNVEITGTGANSQLAGGISGFIIYNSSVTESGNKGNVTTNGYNSTSEKSSQTGGIVGCISATGTNTITYCYNTGNVKGNYKYIGGISGYVNGTSSSISYCYSAGIIEGPANIGGIVGMNKGIITNSYYLENEQNGVRPTTGTATEQETVTEDISVIKNLINLDIWKDYFKADKTLNINKGFPILKWQ